MSEKDKDLMERYIYEVVRRVPKEQREDIAMELRELISDMLEQECENTLESVQESMPRVLERLGDPAEFAKKYRDEGSYLIGPEYYDNYLWILKIVMITTAITIVISAAMEGILESRMTAAIFGMWVGEAITEGIIGAILAFGAVTLIFALLERQKIKIDLSNARGKWKVKDLEENVPSPKVWTPLELPPVPDKRGMISRSDCVVSVVFILLFCGLLVFAPQLFGIYHFEDGKLIDSVCIFNLEKWNLLLPVFLASMMTGLIDEVIKLVHGYYCKAVLFSNLMCSVIQSVLAVVLMKVLPIWNPNFVAELRALDWSFLDGKDPTVYWNPGIATNIVLGIVVLIILIETSVTVYKTWRYGADMR